jgi:hypothetical protein
MDQFFSQSIYFGGWDMVATLLTTDRIENGKSLGNPSKLVKIKNEENHNEKTRKTFPWGKSQ